MENKLMKKCGYGKRKGRTQEDNKRKVNPNVFNYVVENPVH